MNVLVDGRPLQEGQGIRLEMGINEWPHAYWTRRELRELGESVTVVVGRVPLGARVEVDGRLVHVETPEP